MASTSREPSKRSTSKPDGQILSLPSTIHPRTTQQRSCKLSGQVRYSPGAVVSASVKPSTWPPEHFLPSLDLMNSYGSWRKTAHQNPPHLLSSLAHLKSLPRLLLLVLSKWTGSAPTTSVSMASPWRRGVAQSPSWLTNLTRPSMTTSATSWRWAPTACWCASKSGNSWQALITTFVWSMTHWTSVFVPALLVTVFLLFLLPACSAPATESLALLELIATGHARSVHDSIAPQSSTVGSSTPTAVHCSGTGWDCCPRPSSVHSVSFWPSARVPSQENFAQHSPLPSQADLLAAHASS